MHRWAFPTPTLWSEHRHIGGDSQYTSKMDEFQAMVDDLKFKALTWTSMQSLEGDCAMNASECFTEQSCLPKWASAPKDGGQSTISVISDFPHLHSTEARSRFCDNLEVLVQSARRPTILLVTDSGLPCMDALLCCSPSSCLPELTVWGSLGVSRKFCNVMCQSCLFRKHQICV